MVTASSYPIASEVIAAVIDKSVEFEIRIGVSERYGQIIDWLASEHKFDASPRGFSGVGVEITARLGGQLERNQLVIDID